MNTNSKLTEEQINARDANYEPTREQAVEHAKDYLRRFDELPLAQQNEMSPFGFRSHLTCVLSYETEVASLRAQLADANGKTLRDEIAIAAMPAISIHSSPATIEKTARRAYEYADAMLEARGDE